MQVQRQEIPNNTPAQVEQYVTDALALVERLAPPDDLREAVFTQACALFGGKTFITVAPQPVDLAALARGDMRQNDYRR